MRKIEPPGDLCAERRHRHLRDPGDENRLTDLQRAEPANLGEEQRDQIGGAVHASTHQERVERAKREIAIVERAQIDDRLSIGQNAKKEQNAGEARNGHRHADRVVIEPVPARPFFQGVLQAAQKQRHQNEAAQVEPAQQRQVGLVDVDAQPDDDGDGNTGHDVDQKQPMPGEGISQETADRRAEGRRQVQDDRDQHHQSGQLQPAEPRIDDREHAWRDRAAAEPLQRAI